MMKSPIAQAFHRPWIGLVFVGSKHDFIARSNDPAKQLFDLPLSRVRVGSSESLFQDRPFPLLRRPHRATSSKLRIVESVDEVRGPDQQIEVHGPVLAVFKTTKAIQDQGLSRCHFRSKLLMKENAMTPEPVG